MDGALIAARILEVYSLIVLARIIMSWVPMFTNKPLDYSNPLVKFLMDITEPILAPLRRFLLVGMIDLSPMILLIALGIISAALENAAAS